MADPHLEHQTRFGLPVDSFATSEDAIPPEWRADYQTPAMAHVGGQPGDEPRLMNTITPDMQARASAIAGGPPITAPQSLVSMPQQAPQSAAPQSAPGNPLDMNLQDYITLARSGQGGGRHMTPANKQAAREYEVVKGNIDERQRSMGDRAAELGVNQALEQESIGQRMDLTARRLEAANVDAQRAEDERMVRLEGVQRQIETDMADYQKQAASLDPNRLITGNVGRRILFALSAGLGAFGGAITRTPNYALQIIEGALDRDFDAQKQGVHAAKEKVGMGADSYNRLRALGADDRAARAGAKAAILQAAGTWVDGKLAALKGTEQEAAGMQLRDTLYTQADALKAQALALAARPSGVSGGQAKVLKEAMDRFQQQEAINKAYNANRQAGGEPPSDATLERRSKLATRYTSSLNAVRSLERARELIIAGVGTVGARAPALKGGQAKIDADEFRKRIQEAISLRAAARGAAITKSDVEEEEKLVDIINGSYLDSTMLSKLDNMLKLTKERTESILEGQNADDVAAVRKQLSPERANLESIKARFGGRSE